MAEAWHTHAICDDHCVASVQNVGILIWRRDATRAGVEDAFRLYTELSRTHPNGLGWLILVQRTSNPPEGEVRKLLGDVMRRTVAIKAFASVHEGHGFQAASFRAVSTGFTVSTRMSYPRRIFATSEEAARWLAIELAQRNAGPVTADQILSALGDIRSQIQLPPSSASVRPPR